ncbi:MAG: hypothetical protein K0R29_929 [Pseudobdellovibrio sp.]|nr:hypothetical protein [Pseudobdellovibrio sp.]
MLQRSRFTVDFTSEGSEYAAIGVDMKLVFIFVGAFLLYTAKVFSAEVNSATLRVLTYNIKGLPPLLAPGWGNDRFQVIAQKLSERLGKNNGPDVIVLQEVFTDAAAGVVPQSTYPFSAAGPSRDGTDSNGSFQKFYSGGLFILSRYPVLEAGNVHFVNGVCATWDCHSNKGIQFIKISIPGVKEKITVFNTHMQSGSSHDQVRIEQMDTLAKFVLANHKEDELLIFGGDFNTSPERPSFAVLKDTLKAYTAGEFCVANTSSCRLLNDSTSDDVIGKAIDHIFFKGTAKYSIVPLTTERNFKELFNDKTLSDHLGAEALFSIKKIKKPAPHKSHKASVPASKHGA